MKVPFNELIVIMLFVFVCLINRDSGFVPDIKEEKPHVSEITDTLILSRLLNPVIDGGHSLKNWGIKLNHFKIAFEQFDILTKEMLEYCRNDVDLTYKLYKFLLSKMKDFGESIQLEHDVAKIIQLQHERGFKLDIVGAYMLQSKFQEDMT